MGHIDIKLKNTSQIIGSVKMENLCKRASYLNLISFLCLKCSNKMQNTIKNLFTKIIG